MAERTRIAKLLSWIRARYPQARWLVGAFLFLQFVWRIWNRVGDMIDVYSHAQFLAEHRREAIELGESVIAAIFSPTGSIIAFLFGFTYLYLDRRFGSDPTSHDPVQPVPKTEVQQPLLDQPLPAWISPDDRTRMVAKLKPIQQTRIKAGTGICKVRMFYTRTDSATHLAEEFSAISAEAEWPQALPPSVRDPAGPPLPKGIWIFSSLSDPAKWASIFLSNAFDEIGLKHRRSEDPRFRQYDYCLLFLEE